MGVLSNAHYPVKDEIFYRAVRISSDYLFQMDLLSDQ